MNIHRSLHLVLCAAFAAVAVEVSALDAVWNGSKYQSAGIWILPQYWLDSEGNAVEAPPTNINDTAYLAVPSNVETVITFGYNSGHTVEAGGGFYSLAFDKVAADYLPTLNFGSSVTASNYPVQTVSVADPDDFLGWWTSAAGRSELILRATSDHVPRVSNFDTTGYMGINVPDACTTGRVDALYRHGALLKKGQGELVIGRGAGWDSRIYCREGGITLEGSPADVKSIPANAWLHLDATRNDTFTTFTDEGGRTCVAEWRDCDGGTICARTNGFASTAYYLLPYSRAPYISPETSPSGLPLVDFGSRHLEASASSPSNCWLTLSQTCTNAYEVFYAARCTGRYSNLTLLGYDLDGTYDFMGGGNAHVFGSHARAFMSPSTSYITFNGTRASWYFQKPSRYGKTPGNFHVVGAANTKGLRVNSLATDRRYSAYTGGWVLGELLVYTRPLTMDERKLVVDYLMAKWQKDCRSDDVGEIVMDSDNVSLTVPEGRVVRAKTLATHGTKIVKKGGGTLVVDGIVPSDVSIEVQGGGIRVETPAVSTNAPAENPYAWFDATVADSIVYTNEDANIRIGNIIRWNDRRPGATVYAEVPVGQMQSNGNPTVWDTDVAIVNNLPQLVTASSPTGLDAIDFGLYYKANSPKTSTASFMWLQPHYQDKVYAGYMALRVNNNSLSGINYFGSTTTDMLRNTHSMMLQGNYPSNKAPGISWTFDGQPVDPWFSQSALYSNTRWHVVAFSGNELPLRVDLIAKYTLNQEGYCGNIQVGEIILFDRPLSAAERRNTEAYLMARWLGKAHPESADAYSCANYTFEEGADAVYDVDGDMAVTNTPVKGSCALVKRGSGSLAYNDLLSSTNITTISAEEDAITVDLQLQDDAEFRFDSSDLDSFTSTYTTYDGNGGLVTNILDWTDQVKGLVAFSGHKNGFGTTYANYPAGSTCTNPTLQYAEFPGGVMRPVVDFGKRINVATVWDTTVTPKCLNYAKHNNSAGMIFTSYNNAMHNGYLEAHVICADNPGENGGFILSSSQASNGTAIGNRGNGGQMFSTSSGSERAVAYGVIRLDGTNVSYNTVYPSGFHLVSLQPTNAINISSISMDRNCNSGGNRFALYVGYKRAHEEDVFDYIQSKLMYKWLNGPRPIWIRNLSRINASTDAAVTIQTEDVLNVGELSGGGTITAPALTNVSSLVIGGAVEGLTVNGKVTLAASGTVTLTEDPIRLECGEYPLLSTAGLSLEGNISDWTLDSAIKAPARGLLRVRGNNLVLMSIRPGIVVTFK